MKQSEKDLHTPHGYRIVLMGFHQLICDILRYVENNTTSKVIVVVPKECILNNLILTDAILIGNRIQLKILIKKLRQQVFNLSKLSEKLEMLIKTMEEMLE